MRSVALSNCEWNNAAEAALRAQRKIVAAFAKAMGEGRELARKAEDVSLNAARAMQEAVEKTDFAARQAAQGANEDAFKAAQAARERHYARQGKRPGRLPTPPVRPHQSART